MSQIFEGRTVRPVLRSLRTVLIVMMVCLLLAGAVFAASGLLKLTMFRGGGAYDGFALSGGIVRFPLAELGERVREARPGNTAASKWGLVIPTGSWTEAEELVGVRLPRNTALEGMEQKLCRSEDDPRHCEVRVSFSQGMPAAVRVTALYRRAADEAERAGPAAGETVMITARLFTEYLPEGYHTVQLYPADETLVTEEYEMSGGRRALILERSDPERPSEPPGHRMALFAEGGVEYEVIVMGTDPGKLPALLKDVLDGF